MNKKRKMRILFVDDQPMMHRELEKVLKSQGFDFEGVFDGPSCIVKAKENVPDLILLDVMLPMMSGPEVVRKLKENYATKDIPVVFMTVTISKKDDKLDKEVIVDGVSYPAFAKPLYYLKVISVVRKLIKASQKKNGPAS